MATLIFPDARVPLTAEEWQNHARVFTFFVCGKDAEIQIARPALGYYHIRQMVADADYVLPLEMAAELDFYGYTLPNPHRPCKVIFASSETQAEITVPHSVLYTMEYFRSATRLAKPADKEDEFTITQRNPLYFLELVEIVKKEEELSLKQLRRCCEDVLFYGLDAKYYSNWHIKSGADGEVRVYDRDTEELEYAAATPTLMAPSQPPTPTSSQEQSAALIPLYDSEAQAESADEWRYAHFAKRFAQDWCAYIPHWGDTLSQDMYMVLDFPNLSTICPEATWRPLAALKCWQKAILTYASCEASQLTPSTWHILLMMQHYERYREHLLDLTPKALRCKSREAFTVVVPLPFHLLYEHNMFYCTSSQLQVFPAPLSDYVDGLPADMSPDQQAQLQPRPRFLYVDCQFYPSQARDELVTKRITVKMMDVMPRRVPFRKPLSLKERGPLALLLFRIVDHQGQIQTIDSCKVEIMGIDAYFSREQLEKIIPWHVKGYDASYLRQQGYYLLPYAQDLFAFKKDGTICFKPDEIALHLECPSRDKMLIELFEAGLTEEEIPDWHVEYIMFKPNLLLSDTGTIAKRHTHN